MKSLEISMTEINFYGGQLFRLAWYENQLIKLSWPFKTSEVKILLICIGWKNYLLLLYLVVNCYIASYLLSKDNQWNMYILWL